MSHSYAAENVHMNTRSPRAFIGRFAPDAQGNDPVGKPDFSEPILSKNRYGREDILALYRAQPAPQGVIDCRFYVEEPLPPTILSPQTDAEIKAHSNMNSSKAVNNLRDHHQHNGGSSSIGINGGQSPFSPSWAQRGRGGFSRGGGTTGINTRAQALFDPKDPKDRPRNRLRSASEDEPAAAGNGWVQVTKSPKTYAPVTRANTADTAPRNLQAPWRRQDSHPSGSPPEASTVDDGKPREPEWANDESDWPDTSTGNLGHGSFDDDGNFRAESVWSQVHPKLLTQTSVPAPVPVAVPAPEPKWFYCDPNGEVHGPFAKANMQGWFNSGYFSGTLQVRRDCDPGFTTLAELCRLYGETTPFNVRAPTPPVVTAAPPSSPWALGGNVSRLAATQQGQSLPQSSALVQAELQRIEEENRRIAEESTRLMFMQQKILSEKEQFQEKERAIRELEEQVKREKEEFERLRQEQLERDRQKELEIQNELARIRQIEMEKEAALKQKEHKLQLKEEMARQKAAVEQANRRHQELLEQKRQQDEERRNWELQKSQFETCRKKEAKSKEKVDEENKKKKEEELKRAQEEERIRQLEQMRIRTEPKVATGKVTPPVVAPAAQPVFVEKTTEVKTANKAAPWIARAMEPVDTSDARTLRDIQLEEERKMREQLKLDEERQKALKKMQPVETSATWSNTQRINWGSGNGPAWGGAGVNTQAQAPTLKAPTVAKPAAAAKTPVAKKEQPVKKTPPKDDPLSKWVIQRVRKLDPSVEAEVFAGFIRGVQSPNEVEDYIFSYFGETNATKEFCKEFLLRRSELRSKNKSPDRDDLSRPAHAQGPSTAPPAAPTTAVTAPKKKKKGKGVKMIVDGASLGFRPAGDPNRVNAGEIDVVGGSEW